MESDANDRNLDADHLSQEKGEEMQKFKLFLRAVSQSLFLLIILGVCFFWGAGTFAYWEAWVYIGTFYSMMVFNLVYLIRKDPDLLQRRLDHKEDRQKQKWYIFLSNFFILPIYLLPGFDTRFNWSEVPIFLVLIADFIFICAYLLFFWVLRTNSFAGRTIKIDQEKHHVITTGPYQFIRHPLYLAAGTMFGITPLALGSYWGLFFIPFLAVMMVFRIRDEEQMLLKDLPGYAEYMQNTKYRIFPGIW